MPTERNTPLPNVFPWKDVPVYYIDIDNPREAFISLVEKLMDRLRECKIHPRWVEMALMNNGIKWDRRYSDRQWRYDYKRSKSALTSADMWFLPIFAGIFGVRVVWIKRAGNINDLRNVVVSYGPSGVEDMIYNAAALCWSSSYYGTEKYEDATIDTLTQSIRVWINSLAS